MSDNLVVLRTGIPIDPPGLRPPGEYEYDPMEGGYAFHLYGASITFWADEELEETEMTPAELADQLQAEAEACVLGVVVPVGDSDGPRVESSRYVVHCPVTCRVGLCDSKGRIQWLAESFTSQDAKRHIMETYRAAFVELPIPDAVEVVEGRKPVWAGPAPHPDG